MASPLAARLRALLRPEARALVPHSRQAMLEQYVHASPGPQHALDIFKGEWWSHLPGDAAQLQAGQLPLFADTRMTWAIEALGGVQGRSVLELGPLEAGHTYMLENAGAGSILAIEASTKAFLKCLVVKEIVGLERSHFLLGDFEDYLRAGGQRFDVIIASGVLYHVRNPVELIHNLAKAGDRIFIWTHYYDKDRLAAISHMKHRFGETRVAEYEGFRHTLHRYNYGDFLDTTRFAGGSEDHSNWLDREELLGALRHAGFTDITIGQEEPDHTNGPCINLVARKA
jgi:hypothetical protein